MEYCLLVSPLAKDLEIYGVKIVEQRSGAAASALDLTVSSRLIFPPDLLAFQRNRYADKSNRYCGGLVILW